MIRLSSLIVCASILACAMSQTTAPITTTTTPGPMPTPTPVPPTEPPANEYVLKQGNKVCLRMVADITVKFEYETTDEKGVKYNYTLVRAGAMVDNEQSVCGNASVFILRFDPPGDPADPNYVIFTFIKTSDSKAWTALPVRFNFTVTIEEFDGSEYVGQKLSYTSIDNFLGQNVDLGNSYMCNSKEDVKFDSSSSNNTLNLTLMVENLQVQPYFEYVEDKENFDSALDCAADASSKGNKIVPIAVGAALAGLVIVVLIAYLIGRLKSRRQSSYEAL